MCRYLIPMDLTVGQFVYVIRKRISVPPEKAIFIFVNNMLPPTAALMSQVVHCSRIALQRRHAANARVALTSTLALASPLVLAQL